MKRATVRIRCRAPAPPPGSICRVIPSWLDVEVFAVTEDGQEHALEAVEAVTFEASAADGVEPPRITLRLIEAGVDVEGVAELPEGA